MKTLRSPLKETLQKAKSFEVQRAMLAEDKKKKDPKEIERHFLAAAYLEQVLAEDYRQEGNLKMVWISLRSAATCLWRAGRVVESRLLFQELKREQPSLAGQLMGDINELEHFYPDPSSKPKPTRKAKS